MTTRSTTHFNDGDRAEAIIYRHSDGYPEGHGVDLQRFFADVEAQTQDTRFNDPSYLAAKLVVWLADRFARYSMPWEEQASYNPVSPELDAARIAYGKSHPLAFLSVGVVQDDPGDVEFVYVVDCGSLGSDGRPRVTCHEAEHAQGWDGPVTLGAVVEIPEEATV